MRFGLSTSLFQDVRLGPDHLEQIAAHGFTRIELPAARAHFDYQDATSVDSLAGWLEQTGLRLHSIYAPAWNLPGRNGAALRSSIAARDATRRAQVIREVQALLALARTVPFAQLALELGVPDNDPAAREDNGRDALGRSLEELYPAACAASVTMALVPAASPLSSIPAVVSLLGELELHRVGICLDSWRAHDTGVLVDAIEEASGHLTGMILSDVRPPDDERLVPFEGDIDWAAVVFALEKVGFDGVDILALSPTASPDERIAAAAEACRRLEQQTAFHVDSFEP